MHESARLLLGHDDAHVPVCVGLSGGRGASRIQRRRGISAVSGSGGGGPGRRRPASGPWTRPTRTLPPRKGFVK